KTYLICSRLNFQLEPPNDLQKNQLFNVARIAKTQLQPDMLGLQNFPPVKTKKNIYRQLK
ncbi:MAG: hypothetical protein LBB88_04900, partial [Planctomycetaceae bacterium]|nr:hypothetical protein [Planctomycetaceae bacterium]